MTLTGNTDDILIPAGALPMWTVYDHPRDFPYSFVARLSLIKEGAAEVTEAFMCTPDLDELRSWLTELGLVPLSRFPLDDPVVVEVWL